MIETNDLRLGNFVRGMYGPAEVISIDRYSIGIEYEKQSKQLHPRRLIHPILLTPEILEKLGFRKTSRKIEAHFILGIDERFQWYDSTGEVDIELDNTICDYSLSTSTKYLHQLQNLYFTVTGKELPISL